jgi:hypothetical protein
MFETDKLSDAVRVGTFSDMRKTDSLQWIQRVSGFVLVRFMEVSSFYHFEDFVSVIAYGYEMDELECALLMTYVAPYQPAMAVLAPVGA